jgi:hypothetical protein
MASWFEMMANRTKNISLPLYDQWLEDRWVLVKSVGLSVLIRHTRIGWIIHLCLRGNQLAMVGSNGRGQINPMSDQQFKQYWWNALEAPGSGGGSELLASNPIDAYLWLFVDTLNVELWCYPLGVTRGSHKRLSLFLNPSQRTIFCDRT